MNIDSFMPVRLITGRGCVVASAGVFRRYGARCLIVCSRNAARVSGALADCEAALDAGGISYAVFDRIEANPLTATVHAAGETARQIGAEFIVGIGGGSAMDAAKAAAIFAENPGMGHTDLYTRAVPAKALPVLLIGTTAGTGSEVTGVSVLTNADTGRKKSISGPDCYAAVSFCDYGYTMRLPTGITESTALDAFAHAVESMLCANTNDMSALYARRAIGLLTPYVTSILLSRPAPLSEEERESLYIASIYAGLAINITGTAFPHTVGYYLTEQYGVPHGFACAAFMPALLKRAQKYRPDLLGAVLDAAGEPLDSLIAVVGAAARQPLITIGREEALAAAERWKTGVKNFDRSPGGFTWEDAADALAAFG